MMELKKDNVVRRIEGGDKFVITNPKNYPADRWQLVCEKPHEDGDFSYLCNDDKCRCYN